MSSKTNNRNQHSFAQVPSVNMQRSTFDRSHGIKTSFDAGYLVPIFTDEALPGDTFNLSTSLFGRLATPIHPFMDNLYLDTHFFSVPIRLLWDNWQQFMGEQKNPGDSIDYLVPQLGPSAGNAGFLEGSLADYFGIPTKKDDLFVNALHHRAYNLIWNEWFRDENLQISLPVPTDDGPDQESFYKLEKRGKRHDYFTSCLPFPQKGESVSTPIGGLAPVIPNQGPGQGYLELDSGQGPNRIQSGAFDNPDQKALSMDGDSTTGAQFKWTPDTGLSADLSQATAATINEIRLAFQIQKLFERDARGGTRYTEILRAHFGVSSPDARLQRPEYLGGGSTPLNMQSVPQTSSTDGTSPQGNLAAYGTVASASGNGFSKSFTEHCVIIGLVSVRADLSYQEGLHKMWTRRTKHDFYWPALAEIGEQSVLRKEIQASGNPSFDDIVFGYQERYAEYRYKPSMITGQLRSNADTSLDTWHLAQFFGAVIPTLNDVFIEEAPPVDRVIAVPSEPHFILDGHFRLKTARPMPMFGVPGNMDRF